MSIDSSKVDLIGNPSKAAKPTLASTLSGDSFSVRGDNFGSAEGDRGTYTVKVTAKHGNVELTRALAINVVKEDNVVRDYCS